MSKQQELTKLLTTHSERVKMIDMHPKEPLVLCALYSGQVTLWNYETKSLVKSFEIIDQPVRCAKFITRLQSFACGADDNNIRVFNFNTMEKTKTFHAHDDYIRCIAVHDQLPILLTSSDDMTIRQWDWSKGWANTMIYEGHTHYVMSVVFNPKDPTTFATASLDSTIRVWSITSPVANFQLEGHEDGVSCVEYYPGADKPYLVSGSDDSTVRVWDYQTKACLQVLTNHCKNVTTVFFHPDVPLLFSGSEDEMVSVYSTQTWRLEDTLSYNLQRAWAIAGRPRSNAVAVGFDNGMVVLKVGKEEPVISMDNNGKVFIATGNDVSRIDIKGLSEREIADGEIIPLGAKDIGTMENTPRSILHGPSGQYIAVLSEGEYIINSTLQWRPKAFGQCISFAWGQESGAFAVLETPTQIKLYKNFKERPNVIRLEEPAEVLHTGPLLGVANGDAVWFYDWATTKLIRRVDESPKFVEWSDSGELLALVTDTGFFVLKFNAAEVTEHLSNNPAEVGDDGLDIAFDLVEEVDERVRKAAWVGDCLCFVNSAERLNYYIGGEVTTIAVLAKNQHLLGYIAKENRVFCIDNDRNITSYQLFVSVIEYKTAIVREDYDSANEILPAVPLNMRYKVAQFLQARGLLEMALDVTTEDDHRFDLSVQLRRLHLALSITRKVPSVNRWKQIGDLALEQAFFDVAEEALTAAGDLNGLLLLHTCTNNLPALNALGEQAVAKGKTNVAFTCFHVNGRHADCVELLIATKKVAEAAFYARTYCHEKVDETVLKWKNAVAHLPRIRDAIADVATFPNLFPNIKEVPKKVVATESVPSSPAKAAEAPSPVKEAAAPSPVKEAPAPAAPSPVKEAAPSPAKEEPVVEVASPPKAATNAVAAAAPPVQATPARATTLPAGTPSAQFGTPSMVTPSPAGYRGLPEITDSTVRRPAAPPPSARKEGDELDDIFDDDDFPAATTGGSSSSPPKHVDPSASVPAANFDEADDEDWGFSAPSAPAAAAVTAVEAPVEDEATPAAPVEEEEEPVKKPPPKKHKPGKKD